ncbi:MAG: adenylate/guanylate cyclase domain-containing protein [Planctomycetota bacterium]
MKRLSKAFQSLGSSSGGSSGLRHHAIGIGVGCLITLAWLLLSNTAPYRKYVELKGLDLLYLLRPSFEESKSIVHIDIDEKSLEQIGRWPWPRDVHGHLVEVLTDFGAAGIGFDIEFPEKSQVIVDRRRLAEDLALGGRFAIYLDELEKTSREITAGGGEAAAKRLTALGGVIRKDAGELNTALAGVIRDTDALFGAAIRKSGDTYLNFTFLDPDSFNRSAEERLPRETIFKLLTAAPDTPPDALIRDSFPGEIIPPGTRKHQLVIQARDYFVSRERVRANGRRVTGAELDLLKPVRKEGEWEYLLPIPELAGGMKGCGYVSIDPDEDGILRRVHLIQLMEDRLYLQFGFKMLCDYWNIPPEDIRITLGETIELPPSRDGKRPAIRIPIDDKGRMMLNWVQAHGEEIASTAGPAAASGAPTAAQRWLSDWPHTFQHIQYVDVEEYWRTVHRELPKNIREMLSHTRELDTAGEVADIPLPATDDPEALETATAAVLAEAEKVAGQMRAALAKAPERVRRQVGTQLAAHDAEMNTLQGLVRRRRILKNRLGLVKNCLCIIGTSFEGGTDLKPTPLSPLWPGVGIHSNTINTILQKRFLHQSRNGTQTILVILLGAVVTTIVVTRGPIFSTVFTLILILVYFLAGPVFFFNRMGQILPVTSPILAAFSCFAFITSYRQLTEGREKKFIRNTMQSYVPPAVMEEVLRDPTKLKLGGERLETSILFSDIANFTTISEGMDSERLVKFLNHYFDEMTAIIMKHNGTLDKYIGDAIMAIFGAPIPSKNHASEACLSAIEYQKRLVTLREEWVKQGFPEVHARIGIATGIVNVGNMGSAVRLAYTAMGDNVNLAARLEGANKEFGTNILVAEQTYLASKETVEAREIDLIRVKGKLKPIRVYEILAPKGSLSPQGMDLLARYTEATALYQAREWRKASDAFLEILAITPKDRAAYINLSRCLKYKDVPPPEGWDGVFEMKTK